MYVRLPSLFISFSLAATIVHSNALAFSDTSYFPTESTLLHNRVWNPDNHILMNGNTSITIRNTQPLSIPSIPFWPTSPLFITHPPPHSLQENRTFEFSSQIGNEVGDPHLQELTGKSEIKNHTPFTSGSIVYRPYPQLKAWTQFYQNDHFSSRTVGNRSNILSQEDPSWFGENLPPISQLELGFNLEMGPIQFQTQMNQGWIWITSPNSGKPYPWEGVQIREELTLFKRFSINGFVREWISATGNEDPWREYSGKGGWSENIEVGQSTFLWSLQSGVEYTHVQARPFISKTNNITFPINASFQYVQSLLDSSIQIQTQLHGITKRENIYSNGELEVSKHTSSTTLTWMGSGYLGNKNALQLPLTEFITSDSSLKSFNKPNQDQTGGSSGIKLKQAWKTLSWGASTEMGADKGLTYFNTDSLIPMGPIQYRAGAEEGLKKVIWHTRQKVNISYHPLSWFSINLSARFLQFLNEEQQLDYLPSPYNYQISGVIKTPTQLTLQFVSNFLGPKEVRHWLDNNAIHKTRSHWEHNLSITQTFLRERIKLYYTGLHLFGNEVLEHPAGNPLRFRILVGANMSF